YQGSEKIVIRRYTDFVWLRDRLFEKYKGFFIPPLPEKSTVEIGDISTYTSSSESQAKYIMACSFGYHLAVSTSSFSFDQVKFRHVGVGRRANGVIAAANTAAEVTLRVVKPGKKIYRCQTTNITLLKVAKTQ
ncbi:hypothetical protein M8C21_031621, partial [Ambrosia artemisiifolia]